MAGGKPMRGDAQADGGEAKPGVPAGFKPIQINYGFPKFVGPLYCRTVGDQEWVGVRVEDHHCNSGNNFRILHIKPLR